MLAFTALTSFWKEEYFFLNTPVYYDLTICEPLFIFATFTTGNIQIRIAPFQAKMRCRFVMWSKVRIPLQSYPSKLLDTVTKVCRHKVSFARQVAIISKSFCFVYKIFIIYVMVQKPSENIVPLSQSGHATKKRKKLFPLMLFDKSRRKFDARIKILLSASHKQHSLCWAFVFLCLKWFSAKRCSFDGRHIYFHTAWVSVLVHYKTKLHL